MIQSYVNVVLKEIDGLLQERLEIIGEEIASKAQPLTPVKYGRASGSITWATQTKQSNVESPAKQSDAITKPRKKLIVRIGSAVEYFIYLELGTRKMKRFAPLRLAALKARPAIKRIFK